MASRPFKLDTPAGIVRGSDGKFQEPKAEQPLANPLTVEANGGTPQNWAPGIGQGTAKTHSDPIPWPPADQGKPPMKLE